MIYDGEWAFSHLQNVQIVHFCREMPYLECRGSVQQENMHAYEHSAVAALQMEPVSFCNSLLAKLWSLAASSQAKTSCCMMTLKAIKH